jgi:hypothetical protein
MRGGVGRRNLQTALMHTVLDGRYTIFVAIGARLTELRHSSATPSASWLGRVVAVVALVRVLATVGGCAGRFGPEAESPGSSPGGAIRPQKARPFLLWARAAAPVQEDCVAAT